ncbi:hypothetical protein Ahy_B10g104746 [Arachis hypogaea]|uniref:K Homology domain-containing protein n=1 Tax=Arachis hypogaea TaxID=3818 RepID=A0A444X6P7_ARAHY|nr:hypothetical protein Ahy_B10g104746 [Arachis hypogaea]
MIQHFLIILPLHFVNDFLQIDGNVKAWSAVVSHFASYNDNGPAEAFRLFKGITRRLRKLYSGDVVAAASMPDIAALNPVLNSYANLGDSNMFLQVFDEMPQYDVVPDAFSYNILMKLCCRTGRKHLLVYVLERILQLGIPFCVTILHCIVASYVDLGDLETAERLVLAMREGRRDLSRIIREREREIELNLEELNESDDNDADVDAENVFAKLLPNFMESNGCNDLPLLPKAYAPNTRMYTTLMKGYMKAGRVTDIVRMLEAMRRVGAPGFFNEMRTRGIAPIKNSYTTLMKAFAFFDQPKLAHKKAKKVIQKMKDEGFHPDVGTYESFANGIALARRPGEALLLWNEVKERWEMVKNGSKHNSCVPPFKPDEGFLDTLADICVRAAFFRKALEIVACMKEIGISPKKTKFTRIYVEMHSRMFTSKHTSRARQDRRIERKNLLRLLSFGLVCQILIMEEVAKGEPVAQAAAGAPPPEVAAPVGGTGGDGGGGEKKWPAWPGKSVFRMLVPAQKVGCIIGRKREFIKKIAEETHARIKILDGPPRTSGRALKLLYYCPGGMVLLLLKLITIDGELLIWDLFFVLSDAFLTPFG